MKAVFFDRDNTIIKDKNYMHKVEDLDFYEDSFSALRSIQDKGFALFIITNQSGIGRGYFTVDQMHTFHNEMLKRFKEQGVNFIDLAYCPHAPDDGCDCRKPHPKMILDLTEKHGIDLQNSYMIGDKIIDAQAGENAGCTGVTINCKKETEYKDYKSLTEFADSL